MAKIEAKLAAMGLTLPLPFQFAKPNRRGAMVLGTILYVSGHGPSAGPGVKTKGKLGAELSEEEGYAAARATVLSMLASMRVCVGDLDRVRRVISLFGMVNCTPNFERQPSVIDGASDLFYELWGPELGWHTRCAVGMNSLPGGQPIEIKGEFELAG